MNKTGLIFKHEFSHAVRKAGYIVMTLIIPVLGILGIGIFKVAMSTMTPKTPESVVIGYVDELGGFNGYTDQGAVNLVRFASKEAATDALLTGTVNEYIVIPAEYPSTGTVRRYTLEKELMTPQLHSAMIRRFLTLNLLEGKVEPGLSQLITAPLNIDVTRLSGAGTEAKDQNSIGDIIIPALFSLLLVFSLMLGANSLVMGLGEEKESRLVEVLFSSVSIRRFIFAKVLALGIAGLIQVLVWLVSLPLLLNLASITFGGFFSGIQIPGNFLVLGVVYFILGYMLFAVIAVGIGAVAGNAQQGSQLMMIYVMMGFIPLWTASLLFNFPKSVLWTVLTIFPITAPFQAMLRMGISDIPVWEILVSVSVLALSVVFGLLFSTKVFRMYMLMYGKRPKIGEIVRTLKQSR